MDSSNFCGQGRTPGLRATWCIVSVTIHHCDGVVQVVASIDGPVVIKLILEYLERRTQPPPTMTPAARTLAQRVFPELGRVHRVMCAARVAGHVPGSMVFRKMRSYTFVS
jgi:hypothetical protein